MPVIIIALCWSIRLFRARLLWEDSLIQSMEGFVLNRGLNSRRFRILCGLLLFLCLASVSYADDGLIGKWRAIDQTNVILGFRFIPELKFAEDGTLYADGTYGYRIIDEGKFVWVFGNGIEKVYKYQISEDRLMIYSIAAPDSRARFKRVR